MQKLVRTFRFGFSRFFKCHGCHYLFQASDEVVMVGGIILSFGFFYNVAVAIKVTPNSPCVRFCLDGGDLKNASQSNTEREDLVCDDSDVDAKGGKFKDCMECESQSTYWDAASNQSDPFWFLCR